MKEKEITPHIRIFENPDRIVPSSLNIGIKHARGDYIVRIDAHTEYSPDYISKCAELLDKTGAENVGGPMRAVGDGYIGKAVEFAHQSVFGLGGGRFHDETWSGNVDTVYLGAWPRRIFNEVGLFDERLTRNQDIEFNARIRKRGGKIFLTPEIKSIYHCRRTLISLWKQNYANGKWVVYTKKIAPHCLSWRHFIPLIFMLSLIINAPFFAASVKQPLDGPFVFSSWLFAGIIISYLSASLFFSTLLSIRNGLKYLFVLPIVFITLHFSYGIGSICGLMKLRSWIKDSASTKMNYPTAELPDITTPLTSYRWKRESGEQPDLIPDREQE